MQRTQHHTMMQSSSSIVYTLVLFFLLFSPVYSSKSLKGIRLANGTFVSGYEIKLINERLKKINKPFVKSIKSPDGDIIDCVLIHLQPAFDLLELKETLPLDPPEFPKGHEKAPEIKQLWSSKGESCPNGTIPIRRTRASDLLRSNSIPKFAKPDLTGHEYGVASANGVFYGSKARLSLWQPNVVGQDFSLSQIWVVADEGTIQTVEAGWQISPSLRSDNAPRLFTYWTADNYDKTGCYELKCSGFVQTNSKISLGAALGPISTYNGQQFDLAFMIWKDQTNGNWWLSVGDETIGYWPATLFTDLRDHATTVQYGGEVYSPTSGAHTTTQMGSGHFPDEGFGKAAYTRNLEMVDQNNQLNPVSNLGLIKGKPSCYDVKNFYSDSWGNYIYFGGSGNNPNCQ